MNVKPFPSPNDAASFEAGYLAATLRARREFTWAQRAAVMDLLNSIPPVLSVAAPESPNPRFVVLP